MSKLRRYFRPDDIAFLAHVTYNRMPILIEYFEILWNAIEKHRIATRFDLMAWVVLPDHFHMIIAAGDKKIPDLIKKIKLSFSSMYRKVTEQREGRVWQYRFWDHIIRDQADLNHHIDYIHYNPVKHDFVNDPRYWKYSSYNAYLKEGIYIPGWGAKDVKFEGEYGE